MRPEGLSRQKRQTHGMRFEFITVSGNNVAGDDTTRRRVRSHAMADYKRRTTQPKGSKNHTVELDVTPLLDGSLQSTNSVLHTARTEQGLMLRGPSPTSLLDTYRSDPFGTFPINGTHRSRQLWDHMYDGTCPMFRTMSKIGFLDVIRETIALSQMLSASSRHLGLLLGNDSADSYGYSIQATNSLQARLADPAACTSDEVISVVLAFACYANMFRDPDLLNIHMSGLDRILDCRGGIRSLDPNPLLRTMVYWVDVNGSYLQDIVPRYPQPFAVLTARSKLNVRLLDQPNFSTDGDYTAGIPIFQFRDSIVELHDIIRSELSTRDLWTDIIFPGFHISPILHALLSQPRATVYVAMGDRLRECFRLAAVIYLSELRGLFGVDTIPGQLYGSKLQLLLQGVDLAVYAEPTSFYLVWVLTPSYRRHSVCYKYRLLQTTKTS
ncbi:hypothetical protein BJX66DRAFT_335661 [Aspergillus keveii]|uniref:C6 zinc finger domain protein n=1 Tax=Aspergillus keveii TaxID=714993 RepID=A0ABR4GCC0_9EURO